MLFAVKMNDTIFKSRTTKVTDLDRPAVQENTAEESDRHSWYEKRVNIFIIVAWQFKLHDLHDEHWPIVAGVQNVTDGDKTYQLDYYEPH